MRIEHIKLVTGLAAIAVCTGCADLAGRCDRDGDGGRNCRTEQRPPSVGSRAGVVISVANFGAKCDGTSDDTGAIRAAATAAASSSGTLQFPKGMCIIHGTIYVGSHTHVVGDGTTLLAAVPWNDDHKKRYALMENAHYEGGSIV